MPQSDSSRIERDRRFEAIRGALREEGLDAVIAFGTTGVGTAMNGNYAYLTRHVPMYACSLAFLPREGEPALFTPGENQHLEARNTSWIEDVRLSPAPARDLADHLAATFAMPANIAVSSFAAMPAAMADTLRGALGDARLTEAPAPVFAARAVKSGYEQDMLRRASMIADLAMERSIEMLRPGVSELEWKGEIERVMTAQGADGGFNMISAGRPDTGADAFHGYVISPTGRAFAEGDLALLEISPRVGGYYSQIVRLVSFGPVPDEIARAHDACISARRAALAALVPGTPFSAVAQAVNDALAGCGHAMKDVAGAHTIGLDLSEAIITLTNPGTVAEAMVVTVHPMVALDGARQLFVGDTLAIGPSGPIALGETRDDITVLG